MLQPDSGLLLREKSGIVTLPVGTWGSQGAVGFFEKYASVMSLFFRFSCWVAAETEKALTCSSSRLTSVSHTHTPVPWQDCQSHSDTSNKCLGLSPLFKNLPCKVQVKRWWIISFPKNHLNPTPTAHEQQHGRDCHKCTEHPFHSWDSLAPPSLHTLHTSHQETSKK